MRIKNKEIRARRHRKEQKVKDAARELRAQFGPGAKAATETAPAKKAAPKKAPAPKAAPKADKKAPAEAKPKKAPAKAKKAETPAE